MKQLIFLGFVVALILYFSLTVDEYTGTVGEYVTDEKSAEELKESKKEITINQKIEEQVKKEKEEYEKSVLKFESIKNEYKEFNGIYGETRRVSKEDLRVVKLCPL